MEVQIRLDALAERYVRSMETKVEAYKARAWSMTVLGFLIGLMAGMSIALTVLPR